jgi:hypothetical protein
MVVALGGSFCDGVERIGNVLRKDCTICFEKGTNVGRERFDGFVYDQPVCVPSPGKRIVGQQKTEQGAENKRAPPLLHRLYETTLRHAIPLRLVGRTQRAAFAAIVVVNHKSDGHPYKEAYPIHDGEAGH